MNKPVKKKPSPKASQPWSKCIKSLQKRCLETRGAYVFYYAFPKPKGAKPKGKFDLRELSRLRPAREGDPTAGGVPGSLWDREKRNREAHRTERHTACSAI